MDNADRAQEQMERALADFSAARLKPMIVPPEFVQLCEDCGESVGEKRQGYGFTTCIDCQRERER